jgi:DNA repair exonuclease SbcCD ATPase subunit
VENFSTLICLIPIALALLLAGLFLLARHYQKAAETELEQLRGQWRSYEAARQQIARSVQAYAVDLQEPFVSRLAGLQAVLDEINQHANMLSRRRVELKQQANNLSLNRWETMLGAPYLWYFLRKNAARLGREIEAARGELEKADRLEQELQHIGWEVASQARQARRKQQQAHKTLERLRQRQLQGDAFEAALRQVQQAQATLAQLPAYFYDGSQETVISQAGREEISRAYQALETLDPELEHLLAQAQSWEQGCDEAHDAVDVLRRVLADLEQLLSNLPQSIETADYRQRLEQMGQIAQNLHATLSRLEVESLSAVIGEATRLSQFGQEMSHELRRARRELASLEGVIDELSQGFKDLSLRMAALGAKSIHPIAWRETMDALSALNRQANALRAARHPRTPQQIIQDMETAASLRARQKELARACETVELAHIELLQLLSEAELSQFETWLSQAWQVSRQAQAYPAENWSRQDAIASLADELNQLNEAAARLALANPAEPIPEDQIAQRLQDARLLTENFQRMKRRVVNIQARLQDLQEREKSALQALEGAHSALVQIGFIVRSNDFLTSAALQEQERLSKEMQELIADLAQRQRGSVEKKARRAAALVERAEQAVNDWLNRLSRDAQELAQELATTLRELDQIAALDEKPIAEARRLLESSLRFASAAKTRRSLDELIPELKQRSDHWQACTAALKALGDFKPLIETYKEAQYQRDKTRRALNEAMGGLRQKRAWPPTAVTLEQERQELEAIEQQWQALKEGPARAIARVAQLSNLGARYQALGERIVQAGERAAREQAEAEEIEAQVNEASQMWRNLQDEYRSYPQAAQEIQELLDATHRELAQIRRNYSQGNADYTQTLQALKSLLKQIRFYQVALDEESALDASGSVHRRRESRRGERF